MAAEWTQLPKELLDEISTHLDTQFDNLRFRSICATWRSAVPTRPPRFPTRFPILPNDGISDTTWGFHLSKRTIFVLENPNKIPQIQTPDAWIVKIEEDSRQKLHLYHPLTRARLGPLPANFPRVFDLWGLRVRELGQEYVLQYINYRPLANSLAEAGHLYMEKVVFKFLGNERNDFVLLTIHVSGKLAVFKSGDLRWTTIQDMPSPYDDVILYKGKFYAVDNTGRTVVVELSANVGLVANPVFGGDKKFLVESNGDLLLVDMYLSMEGEGDGIGNGDGDSESSGDDELLDHFDYCISERTVRFRVFKLDEEGKKWDEVKNMGDRVLFLGDDCTFSASVAGISGLKGNCIFFVDNYFHLSGDDQGELKGLDIGVFDMESGKIDPLESYPSYSMFFWPPPEWVTSNPAVLEVQNHLEGMAM